MTQLQQGDLLWQPTEADVENANITDYIGWLAQNRDVHVADYGELWQWSVDNIGEFWSSLFAYFDLVHTGELTPALANSQMPGAEWFPNATLNYAENIFAQMTDKRPIMHVKSEDQPLRDLAWADMYAQVNRLATLLRGLGVEKGDRVVAYLPNIPEAMIAVLAVTSIGAIWSSTSPDFGSRSVLDRFTQIEPKVLIAVDGYQYGGKTFDRSEIVAELMGALPSLQHTILLPTVNSEIKVSGVIDWDQGLAAVSPPEKITFEQLSFDHPLWVLYSSGTTGLPKPIVHGHGGVLLEHVKSAVFHNDLKPSDRFFWYSSTGWMMWNYLLGSLLSGASIIVYDGSPAYPNMNAIFEMAEQSGMTYFGTSAAFISACIKRKIEPNKKYDLSKIRGVGSTGSPLSIDGFQWVYDNINDRLALESLSGGTDLCTAFVGGARTLPIYAGEIQGASLGAKVQAWNDAGEPVLNEVGELIIAEPMPSMPIYFWGDEKMERYTSSYFELFANKWRHGDWIEFNDRGGCVIYGRSDSTINRQGIRMGTSEIYRVVESFDEVSDSLIIDLELLGRESFMPLFLVLREGESLTDELQKKIKQKLRAEVSPRHVPNDIVLIKEVPYTLSGKKMEVPIRKVLLGMDANKAANLGAMRNPESVAFFEGYAKGLG